MRRARAMQRQLMGGTLNEVVALLKDDYPQLMDVLTAVSEIL